MFDLAHDEYALDPWRTFAVLAATGLVLVLAIRTTAVAATALGVDASMPLYCGVALLVVVPPMTVLRLWSDARFDHAAYRDARTTRELVRDHAIGVAVALLGFAAFVVLLGDLPDVLVGLLAIVEGVLLGITATMGAARAYYDDEAHPHYFALLDRLA